MLNERRVAGAVLLLLGALAVLEAWRLAALREEMVAGAAVGDDTFPMIVGVALIAMGVHAVVLARWSVLRVAVPAGRARRRLIGCALLLVAYYAITPALGYTLATLLVGSALFRVMGSYAWWAAVLLGVATTGALYLMFRVWLLQPLPTGWLGI
jgi:hypothetical protein